MRSEKKKGGLPTNKTIKSAIQFLQEGETQSKRKNTDKQKITKTNKQTKRRLQEEAATPTMECSNGGGRSGGSQPTVTVAVDDHHYDFHCDHHIDYHCCHHCDPHCDYQCDYHCDYYCDHHCDHHYINHDAADCYEDDDSHGDYNDGANDAYGIEDDYEGSLSLQNSCLLILVSRKLQVRQSSKLRNFFCLGFTLQTLQTS